MKKYSLLFVAAGMLAFAACSSNSDNKNNSQAEIDSIANVKAAAMQAQMAAQNDSVIKATAKAKADSMMAYKNGEVQGMKEEAAIKHKRHTADDAAADQPQAPAPPMNPKADKFNRMNGNNTNNTPVAPDPQKADKFRRMNGGN